MESMIKAASTSFRPLDGESISKQYVLFPSDREGWMVSVP